MLNIQIQEKKYRFGPQDIVKITIGRWFVIKYAKKDKGEHLYLCKCKCGVIELVRRCNLISGDSKSCGCLGSERTSEYMKGKKYRQKIKPEEYSNIWNSKKESKDIAKDYNVSVDLIYKIKRKRNEKKNM